MVARGGGEGMEAKDRPFINITNNKVAVPESRPIMHCRIFRIML